MAASWWRAGEGCDCFLLKNWGKVKQSLLHAEVAGFGLQGLILEGRVNVLGKEMRVLAVFEVNNLHIRACSTKMNTLDLVAG